MRYGAGFRRRHGGSAGHVVECQGRQSEPGHPDIYFRMFQCPVGPWAIQQVQEKTPPAEYPSVEKQKEEGVTPLPVYANDSTNTCAVSTRKNMVKGYTVA